MKSARLAITALGLAACGTPAPHAADLATRDMSVPQDPPLCTDGTDGGLPPTFATVQRIFSRNCIGSGCHDSDPFSPSVMLDLRPGHAWQSIVRIAAAETCDGGAPLTRIVPGDAGASWLYHKLTDSTPCSGSQMPQGEIPYVLHDCELLIVRRWIESGAPQ